MDKILNISEIVLRIELLDWVELHVHHTYIPSHKNFTGSNHRALQESMRRYHMDERGWSDIGQHLTIMPDGKCVTGRDWTRSPASISGHNKIGAFAVEILGNFDKGNDEFQGSQKEAMLTIANWFITHDLPVIFHREHSTKTCPGSSIGKALFMEEAKNMGASAWAVDGRNWCIENGISDGNRPKDNVTREELWTMLYRASEKA